ncbi:TetR-like C-terminal domain-containing protein [Streptomyces sp. NPDC056501]|uniref:TetR-like C-terminal domain-containing protein n=1 Tax=Streptomyces sp. NPDC056501 TaxID=3345841 RepID=UPI0036A26166
MQITLRLGEQPVVLLRVGVDQALHRAPPEALDRAAAPILRAAQQLAGDKDALEAARLVTAWATGFIEMELAGAFRLGGDVNHAFAYGLAHMRRALADDTPASAGERSGTPLAD